MSHASGTAALIKYLKLKTYLLLCGYETAENCHFKKTLLTNCSIFVKLAQRSRCFFFIIIIMSSQVFQSEQSFL